MQLNASQLPLSLILTDQTGVVLFLIPEYLLQRPADTLLPILSPISLQNVQGLRLHHKHQPVQLLRLTAHNDTKHAPFPHQVIMIQTRIMKRWD
jgi:hypothetical protein